MPYVARLLGAEILRAARGFRVVLVTGPRRSGKTTLLRRLLPRASYHLLEDPDLVGRIRADPRGFVESCRLPAILDEIQNAPEILPYIRTDVDGARGRGARWFLTGSQEPALMRGVTESMAGRVAIHHLLPFSAAETRRVGVLGGGFPEVVARPSLAPVWFRSYLQTYLERDIRGLSPVRDLSAFRRFLSLLAARVGQVLNRTEIAAPLGVSVPTVSEWLRLLETTHQVLLVPPYFENFGKRLIKSPKVYLADTGLAAHLLGIETRAALERSPFRGPLHENFAATEIAKAQVNAGRRPEVYFFRNREGLEVDFVVPGPAGDLLFLEVKAARTVRPADAEPIRRLARAAAARGRSVRSYVVHLPGAPIGGAPRGRGTGLVALDRLHAVVAGG